MLFLFPGTGEHVPSHCRGGSQHRKAANVQPSGGEDASYLIDLVQSVGTVF